MGGGRGTHKTILTLASVPAALCLRSVSLMVRSGTAPYMAYYEGKEEAQKVSDVCATSVAARMRWASTWRSGYASRYTTEAPTSARPRWCDLWQFLEPASVTNK